MDLNLQDNQQLWTFDFGIKNGNLVADSDLVWCVDSKEDALIVRNIQNRNDASLPYHNFGTGSNVNFARLIKLTQIYFNKYSEFFYTTVKPHFKHH